MRDHDRAPVHDHRRLDELDGAAGSSRVHVDREGPRRDHPEDVETDPRQLQVGAGRVPVDLMRHDAADRRHVLLVVTPGALGVQRRRIRVLAESAVERR